MAHPPVCPHGGIEQIADNVFALRGSFRMNAMIRISRNMAIVRSGTELTLINPIRVSEDGLKKLDELGGVKHLVRLGGFHGADDPFYMERYRPTFWAQAGELGYKAPVIDKPLADGGELPFPGAHLFCFQGMKVPEGAILVESGRGLLLTCDAIQHYGDYSRNNIVARLMMPFIGFPRRTIVGPVWLRLATPDGASLRSELERLLNLKFDALLAAHGTYLPEGAHAGVRRAVEDAFAAQAKRAA
jgi:hypothetical protein